MPGLDRQLDPMTGDYVDAGRGEYSETPTIQPAVYHQFMTERGAWCLDADAGSDLHLVLRRVLNRDTIVFAIDVAKTTLQPFVDAGLARDVRVNAEGSDRGLLTMEVALTDTATGQEIAMVAPVGEV